MARKQSKRIELDGAVGRSDVPQAGGLTHNPFAALRATLPLDESSDAHVDEASPERVPQANKRGDSRKVDAAPPALAPGASLVVRHERKGHGGKTVTVIDLSRTAGLSRAALDSLAKDLRKALGAGARAGEQEITVQGDLVERVARFLESTYGARVTLGTRG